MMKKRITVGLIITQIHTLSARDKLLIENILKSGHFNIKAIILDMRNTPTFIGKIVVAFKTGRLSGFLLYALVNKIEKIVSRKKYHVPKEFSLFEKLIGNTMLIETRPKRLEDIDYFSADDSEKIKAMGLDVILYSGSSHIVGDLLTAAKFGIWSCLYADSARYRGILSNFWSVYYQDEIFGITVRLLTDDVDEVKVLAKGFYNSRNNAVANYQFSLYQSLSLVTKTLEQLYQNRHINILPGTTYSRPLFESPTLMEMIKYSGLFARTYFRKFFFKLIEKTGMFRHDCWSIFIGKGSIRNAILCQSMEVKPHKGEFWADPFLFEYIDKLYLFFESYDYKKKHGKISVCVLDDNNVQYIGDAISCDVHYSYPYIFEDNQTIYMIPESSANGRIEVWQSAEFPLKWTLSHTAFEGKHSLDTTVFKYNNQWWLFTTHVDPVTDDDRSALYIYAVDSPMLREIIPHKKNPVIIDSRTARNAGRPYVEDGALYRPSQYNVGNIYGRGLNIMKIIRLSLDEYEEELDCRVMPDFKPGLSACHHLDQAAGYYVVDGCKKIQWS